MFETNKTDNLALGAACATGSLVLVVEEDVDLRQRMCGVLKENGFRIVTAGDGAETRQQLAEHRPDIVVLDCLLPDTSGVDLCRALRREPYGSQVPILLTMHDADTRVIGDAFAAGATDFLPAPFNLSLLPYRVSYLLRARRVSLQLNSSENRQHALFEGLPDPLLVFEQTCKVAWANRSSVESLQSSRSEVIGKSCHDLWGAQHSNCQNCDIARCFATGETITGTRYASEGKVWGVRLFPIRGESGQVESVVKLAHDITEKIKLQAEATRTSQLAAIGELAAGVAHEINNPIHGVINYAQILLNRGTIAEQERELVERIQKEGGRVAGIVQNLLGFSRPARDEYIPENIVEALDEAISLFASKLKHDRIRLQVNGAGGSFLVPARRQLLQQVFINLISNARQALNSKTFTEPDDKLLQIDLEREGAETLVINFYDCGCGIPAELLQRVTQPFVTTKPTGQGTGLGLSISENIVREHGGELRIDSEEGRYTRIGIVLPLVV